MDTPLFECYCFQGLCLNGLGFFVCGFVKRTLTKSLHYDIKLDTLSASFCDFLGFNAAPFQNSTSITLHIQGWVQLLFSIPERRPCERVQPAEIPWQSDGLISSQIPLLRLTASLSNTSNALSGMNKWATPDLLLMCYRFSLLPRCFTMHPLC